MIKKFEDFIDIVNEDSYGEMPDEPSDYSSENGPYILRLDFRNLDVSSLRNNTRLDRHGKRSKFYHSYNTSDFVFDNNKDVRSLLAGLDAVIKTANKAGKSVVTGIDMDEYRYFCSYNNALVYPFEDYDDVHTFLKNIKSNFEYGFGSELTLRDHEIISTKKELESKYGIFTLGDVKPSERFDNLMDLFEKNKGRTKLIE